MSLAVRVIPLLLQRGSLLVKGSRFESWRTVGHARQAVAIHQARGVDELLYLDIAATPQGAGPDLRRVESLTQRCFMPITVGGGVRSVEDVRDLLLAGADKVAVGACGDRVELLRQIADRFGRQVLVVVMSYRAWAEGALAAAAVVRERWGAGEIMLQCVERDGMMNGYDLAAIREVSAAVSIPVIAGCGCGSYEHMAQAVEAGASAVAAGAMFQFTDATPAGAARFLAGRGIETRIGAVNGSPLHDSRVGL